MFVYIFVMSENTTLDTYKTWFNTFANDQPIEVQTFETLEWCVDSPPEQHLFEEYPALKSMKPFIVCSVLYRCFIRNLHMITVTTGSPLNAH